MYKSIGIEVSKNKTSISLGQFIKSEFLWNVYAHDSMLKTKHMAGYAFRLTSSLIYSKPWGSLDAINSEWD